VCAKRQEPSAIVVVYHQACNPQACLTTANSQKIALQLCQHKPGMHHRKLELVCRLGHESSMIGTVPAWQQVQAAGGLLACAAHHGVQFGVLAGLYEPAGHCLMVPSASGPAQHHRAGTVIQGVTGYSCARRAEARVVHEYCRCTGQYELHACCCSLTCDVQHWFAALPFACFPSHNSSTLLC
jgi:hypothetical protein